MNVLNLSTTFFGIYLIIPFLLGCFLLFGVGANRESMTKAQRLAGVLLIIDALFLLVRTTLAANGWLHDPVFRRDFFILDSTIITLFTLVPYTVITENYPKWWMYVTSLLPALLIPIVHLTGWEWLATWSHLLPITGISIVLIMSIKAVKEADSHLMDQFANPEIRAKSWVIYLCISFLIVSIFSLSRYFYHGHAWYNTMVSLMWSGLMIAIYVMLTRQKSSCGGCETALFNPETKKAAEISDKTKLRNYETIRQALTKCTDEQIYLRGDLSVDSLARECSTNRTYLSSYLKEELHQNFYEYINTMRLKHVDELLQNANMSQETIAIKCGFNNARTMRSVYQKIRGKAMTR